MQFLFWPLGSVDPGGPKNHIDFMNGGISKLLRRWAGAKRMNYALAKRLYKRANKNEREQILKEINDFFERYISPKIG